MVYTKLSRSEQSTFNAACSPFFLINKKKQPPGLLSPTWTQLDIHKYHTEIYRKVSLHHLLKPAGSHSIWIECPFFAIIFQTPQTDLKVPHYAKKTFSWFSNKKWRRKWVPPACSDSPNHPPMRKVRSLPALQASLFRKCVPRSTDQICSPYDLQRVVDTPPARWHSQCWVFVLLPDS